MPEYPVAQLPPQDPSDYPYIKIGVSASVDGARELQNSALSPPVSVSLLEDLADIHGASPHPVSMSPSLPRYRFTPLDSSGTIRSSSWSGGVSRTGASRSLVGLLNSSL